MKPAIAAFLFLVSWQEYTLKSTEWKEDAVFTIETVDKSIKLKTQEDVDKFTGPKVLKDPTAPPFGMSSPPSYTDNQFERKGGLIGPNAFNIKVKEIKE